MEFRFHQVNYTLLFVIHLDSGNQIHQHSVLVRIYSRYYAVNVKKSYAGIGEELKCTCNSVIVAAVSSVITFIAIFIILVIGFVCCRYFRIGTKSSIPSQEQTISTLQRQDAHSEFEYREQSLGLTENVAYEPIQVTRESSH